MTRVLITGARAPAALHLARLLGEAGHHVVMADSLRWPVAAASAHVAAYVRLPPANGSLAGYRTAVAGAIADHRIALVVPTCEEVFHLARAWAGGRMEAALFAPDLDRLRRAHHKYDFIRWAADLGLPVPQTELLEGPDDVAKVAAQSREMVFKPVWSRFATQTLIRPERLSIAPTKAAPWVAQAFLPGEEVCAYAIAHQGRMVGMAAYRPVYRAGQGAGIAFQRDDDPGIADYLTRLVAGTGWHGQIALDLIRGADGVIRAIECNPRATSGLHFFRAPQAFADAVIAGSNVVPDVSGLQAVKLALALYGPWQAPGRVWRDLRQAADVMHWPGDPAPRWRQPLAIAETVGIALRHGLSLTAATTRDIAWDGDQSA